MSGIAVEADPAVPEKSNLGGPIVAAPDDAAIVSTTMAEREEMPLPTDARTVFLGGLFLLACLAAMYVASDIVLPVVLAIVLKLLLQPLVRVLDGFHVPRVLGALVALLVLIAVFAGLGTALTRPAIDWAGKLPEALPRVEEELRLFSRPLRAVQDVVQQVETIANGPAPRTPPPRAAAQPPQPQPQPQHGSALLSALFSSTRAVAAGFFTTILVLFYLLVSGETFLRRLVEILPRFDDKRRAVEISLHVEHDVSVYLVTITIINAGVGIAAGCVMWLCGVGDPLLWGCIAFVLNYVPILGPIMGVVLFAIIGLLSLGAGIGALLPAALYFLIHIAEGEFITPMVVARRFTVNPVAVVLGLVFWYWMWGVPGAILAVPMLAIIKIVCDDLPPLRAFGHFLEG
jgi:predicted PurR-regulated permease PerM